MSALLDTLRELGLPMTSAYRAQTVTVVDARGEDEQVTRQTFYGWTTDKAKAEAAREAGATVTTVGSTDDRFSGWEVAVSEIVG